MSGAAMQRAGDGAGRVHGQGRDLVDRLFHRPARHVDRELHGGEAAVRARYERRYVPGEQMYLGSIHPRDRADAVVINDDPSDPRLIFREA